MRLYQLHKQSTEDSSDGFEYFLLKGDATKKLNKVKHAGYDLSEVKPIDVVATKEGICAALNHYASHPDNG